MTAHLSTGPRMILEENEEAAQNGASPSLQLMEVDPFDSPEPPKKKQKNGKKITDFGLRQCSVLLVDCNTPIKEYMSASANIKSSPEEKREMSSPSFIITESPIENAEDGLSNFKGLLKVKEGSNSDGERSTSLVDLPASYEMDMTASLNVADQEEETVTSLASLNITELSTALEDPSRSYGRCH